MLIWLALSSIWYTRVTEAFSYGRRKKQPNFFRHVHKGGGGGESTPVTNDTKILWNVKSIGFISYLPLFRYSVIPPCIDHLFDQRNHLSKIYFYFHPSYSPTLKFTKSFLKTHRNSPGIPETHSTVWTFKNAWSVQSLQIVVGAILSTNLATANSEFKLRNEWSRAIAWLHFKIFDNILLNHAKLLCISVTMR